MILFIKEFFIQIILPYRVDRSRTSTILLFQYSLSFIVFARSSFCSSVSSTSWTMNVRLSLPQVLLPCVGFHNSSWWASSSLLRQQCPLNLTLWAAIAKNFNLNFIGSVDFQICSNFRNTAHALLILTSTSFLQELIHEPRYTKSSTHLSLWLSSGFIFPLSWLNIIY